jgi:hypothetical protein
MLGRSVAIINGFKNDVREKRRATLEVVGSQGEQSNLEDNVIGTPLTLADGATKFIEEGHECRVELTSKTK